MLPRRIHPDKSISASASGGRRPLERRASFVYAWAMPRFGAHLSVAEFRPAAKGRACSRAGRDGREPVVTGPAAAIHRARQLKCDCVQLFLRPNRQWRAPKLSDTEIAAFRAAVAQPVRRRKAAEWGPGGKVARWTTSTETIHPVVSHASYLINIGGPPGRRPTGGSAGREWPTRDVRARSIRALKDELRRAVLLGVPYVVLHPGGHMGDGEQAGLRRVVEALDEVIDPHRDDPVQVLLETTAGQGTSLGHRLEHLAFILDHAACGDRLAVCADTCHMFAAGYDFRNKVGYEATLSEIDRTVGLERLAVWHLNDCLKPLGCRVDRHAHIGRGEIGREAFRLLVSDSRFADLPMILETPKADDAGRQMDPVNLRLLRRLAV